MSHVHLFQLFSCVSSLSYLFFFKKSLSPAPLSPDTVTIFNYIVTGAVQTVSTVFETTLNTAAATDSVSFSRNGRDYIVISNGGANVDVYISMGLSTWSLVQSIPALTPEALDVIVFQNTLYLGIANSYDPNQLTMFVNSEVHTFDDASGQFKLLQGIPTSNCSDVKFLELSGLQTTMAVVFANYYSATPDVQTTQLTSPIYSLDTVNRQFNLLQSITTTGASAVASFTLGQTAFLAFAEFGLFAFYPNIQLSPSPINNSIASYVYYWNTANGLFSLATSFTFFGAQDVKFIEADQTGNNGLLAYATLNSTEVFSISWNSNTMTFQSSHLQSFPVSAASVTFFTLQSTIFLTVSSYPSPTIWKYISYAVPPIFQSIYSLINAGSRKVNFFQQSTVKGNNTFLLSLYEEDQFANVIPTMQSTIWSLFVSDGTNAYGNRSAYLYFAPNQATLTVTVPLFPAQGVMVPQLEFAVTLSQPSVGAQIGSLATETVIIAGDFPIQVEFLDNNNQTANAVTVMEGSYTNTKIAKAFLRSVPVNDSSYSFSLSDPLGQFIGLFNVDSNGDVYVLGKLSRDSNPPASYGYNLLILCTVNMPSGNTIFGESYLIVNVGDSSQVAPVFIANSGSGNFQATIIEQMPIGTQVIQLQTTDNDNDVDFVFSIASTSPSTYNGVVPFIIDPNTGIISTAVVFNYSVSLRPFLLSCTAANAVNQSLTATTSVIITVLQLDNTIPKWLNSSVNVTVPRLLAVNAVAVNNLMAIVDPALYNSVSFTVVSGNDERYFLVEVSPNGQSLSFILLKPLNYYNGTRDFTITLSACTTAKSNVPPTALCSILAVSINVFNVNQYAPVFNSLSLGPNTVSNAGVLYIMDTASVGTSLATISFSDKDILSAGFVTYSLNTNLKFSISNSLVGDITVQTLGFSGNYNLTILASDHGMPPKSTPYVLNAVVLDQPVFTSSTYSAIVIEGASPQLIYNHHFCLSLCNAPVRTTCLHHHKWK